jgi:hypothetical protein
MQLDGLAGVTLRVVATQIDLGFGVGADPRQKRHPDGVWVDHFRSFPSCLWNASSFCGEDCPNDKSVQTARSLGYAASV